MAAQTDWSIRAISLKRHSPSMDLAVVSTLFLSSQSRCARTKSIPCFARLLRLLFESYSKRLNEGTHGSEAVWKLLCQCGKQSNSGRRGGSNEGWSQLALKGTAAKVFVCGQAQQVDEKNPVWTCGCQYWIQGDDRLAEVPWISSSTGRKPSCSVKGGNIREDDAAG